MFARAGNVFGMPVQECRHDLAEELFNLVKLHFLFRAISLAFNHPRQIAPQAVNIDIAWQPRLLNAIIELNNLPHTDRVTPLPVLKDECRNGFKSNRPYG